MQIKFTNEFLITKIRDRLNSKALVLSTLGVTFENTKAEEIKNIFLFLDEHPEITELYLGCAPQKFWGDNLSRSQEDQLNNIKDEGARILAEALATNNTLLLLDLDSTNIGDVGAKALAEALTTGKNNTLKSLVLNNNSKFWWDHQISRGKNVQPNYIGNQGAIDLAKMLHCNRTLEQLSLFGNKIGDEGAAALATCQLGREAVLKIDLTGNNFKAVAYNRIILENNPVIRENNKRITTKVNCFSPPSLYQQSIFYIAKSHCDKNEKELNQKENDVLPKNIIEDIKDRIEGISGSKLIERMDPKMKLW